MCLMLLLILAQQPAQPAACAADGYVVNVITGEPIPRAHVAIGGPAQSGTVADSSGRWQLSGIACGRLNLSATKPGFLPRALTATTSADFPAHDFRLELVPQSVVAGRVIDESGDPVQNAQIAVMSSRVVLGKRIFQQSGGGNTNDLGEYRIAGLTAGKVILCARGGFDVDAMLTAEKCYPGPVDGGVASALTLPAGREARVDFTLSRVPAVRVRGKLAGLPEGAAVSLMLQPRGAGGPGRPAALQRDGTFEARAVPPGSWMLSVDYWEGGKRLMARVPVDVGGADVDGVVVHLESGFVVSGALRVESQSGRTPPQLVVSLRGVDPVSAAGPTQWDKTQTAFTIADIMPGTYLLNLNVQAPFYLKSATLGGRDVSHDTIPIQQAATGPIDIVIADDGGSVQGHIEDSNGEVTTGWVMVLREGHAPSAIQTSADGHFRIGGLAPGDYRAYAWDDYNQVEYADPEWMRVNSGNGQAVSVTSGQTTDVKLVKVNAPKD